MCGITGILSFNSAGQKYKAFTKNATKTLSLRGPDSFGIANFENASLGHTRLSIIDTSSNANQPFTDNSGRYTIVFNGEIYNHKEFIAELKADGIKFISTSDTEILLYLIIKYKEKAFNKINGCFSLCFYDKETQQSLIARDRLGINPLLYYHDNDKLIFGSELKAIFEYKINKEINNTALSNYFRLNYIPKNQCIIKGVQKLLPGTYLSISNKRVETKRYYSVTNTANKELSYKSAKEELNKQLHQAIKYRMIADVPLGAFLSGGIDSSVIVSIASQYTNNLNTFSVGYTDEAYFDETKYADLVAKKFNTNHHVFKLSNQDLYNNLFSSIDYLDEPFADSSALAVNILCKNTKENIKVALSGDGADEIFSGYNKHNAHFNASKSNFKNSVIKNTSHAWKNLPKSRNNKITDTIRKLDKFSKGLSFSAEERYLFWASIGESKYVENLLGNKFVNDTSFIEYNNTLTEVENVLLNDTNIVLPNDMLTKVDLMSMANSLEVRTPFLDHNVVDFAFSLPEEFKINSSTRKRLLKETYKDILPEELYNRPKHGFEVPLLSWLRNELWDWLDKELLSENFIVDQGVFNYDLIKKLKKQLHSSNPNDVASKLWALIVFQNWYLKYFL